MTARAPAMTTPDAGTPWLEWVTVLVVVLLIIIVIEREE